MSIPTAQLETWTHQGGTTASANAYAAIVQAINARTSNVRGHSIDIFLQGSYRNETNIYGDSDIDVVILTNETAIDDGSGLAPYDRHSLPQWQAPVYPFESFKQDVIAAMRVAFGPQRVRPGTRAIHVNSGHGREADVIPAIRYRRYYRNALLSQQLLCHDGIALRVGAEWIYNYPLQHIQNGQAKNSMERTARCYKPTVRMFKNARNRAIERGVLEEADAPSYFIEGLLYNVPDNCFSTDRTATFIAAYDHLSTRRDNTIMSQNGMIPLIGAASTQWQLAACQRFMAGMHRLWIEWA